MTIREYIAQKMSAFGTLTEADFADLKGNGVSLDDEYDISQNETIGKALCSMIEERILAPYVSNISENGFSMSWDYTNLGKYFLFLCRKYGITPNDETLSLLGISMIKDLSSIW